jgi:hypothetical protein
MSQSSPWESYTGTGAIVLAILLLIVTGVLIYLGTRLRLPLAPKRPGKAVTTFMLLLWFLSIAMSLFAISAYILALARVAHGQGAESAPTNPISPVTFSSVVLTFIIVAFLTRKHGLKVALGSAAICALAAPWIFELPFDLIVMARTAQIPPRPNIYIGLFFFPLFLIEISTFSLLTLSPVMKLSKYTLFALAGMFFIFAVWAFFGFSYPSSPLPIALNVISKILAFVAAITLFLPSATGLTANNAPD